MNTIAPVMNRVLEILETERLTVRDLRARQIGSDAAVWRAVWRLRDAGCIRPAGTMRQGRRGNEAIIWETVPSDEPMTWDRQDDHADPEVMG
jgi:hypothetical protein